MQGVMSIGMTLLLILLQPIYAKMEHASLHHLIFPLLGSIGCIGGLLIVLYILRGTDAKAPGTGNKAVDFERREEVKSRGASNTAAAPTTIHL